MATNVAVFIHYAILISITQGAISASVPVASEASTTLPNYGFLPKEPGSWVIELWWWGGFAGRAVEAVPSESLGIANACRTALRDGDDRLVSLEGVM